MHFVFNCICVAIFCLTTSSPSARSSAASYFKSWGSFSPYNFQSFSRCFLFCCFICCRSHPRVEFLDLASHTFQFSFTHAAFPFYSSSYLQQFGFFFILSNTVKSCLQAYVLQSSQKILYFFSEKNNCNTVSGLILQSPR